MGAHAGNGTHRGCVGHVVEIAHQFKHILRKAVIRGHVTAQGAGGGHVGAGRTAQAQIDPPGEQGGKGAELFGHDQRCMVRQHDPARTHTDGAGCGRHLRNHNRRGRTGDAGHVVMLGQPIAVIARLFCQTRKIDRIRQSIGGSLAFGDGRQIKDREFLHGGSLR